MRPSDGRTIGELAVQLPEDEIRVARELHSLNFEIEQFAAKSAGQPRQLLVVCVRAGMQLNRHSAEDAWMGSRP
jgi:hypothetical protein